VTINGAVTDLPRQLQRALHDAHLFRPPLDNQVIIQQLQQGGCAYRWIMACWPASS
jgi:hypothetical protein